MHAEHLFARPRSPVSHRPRQLILEKKEIQITIEEQILQPYTFEHSGL
jgi:hypothetical protein